MHRLQDTEGFILIKFGTAAKEHKARGLQGQANMEAIKVLVKPYLERLRHVGVDQPTRMSMLMDVYRQA